MCTVYINPRVRKTWRSVMCTCSCSNREVRAPRVARRGEGKAARAHPPVFIPGTRRCILPTAESQGRRSLAPRPQSYPRPTATGPPAGSRVWWSTRIEPRKIEQRKRRERKRREVKKRNTLEVRGRHDHRPRQPLQSEALACCGAARRRNGRFYNKVQTLSTQRVHSKCCTTAIGRGKVRRKPAEPSVLLLLLK